MDIGGTVRTGVIVISGIKLVRSTKKLIRLNKEIKELKRQEEILNIKINGKMVDAEYTVWEQVG